MFREKAPRSSCFYRLPPPQRKISPPEKSFLQDIQKLLSPAIVSSKCTSEFYKSYWFRAVYHYANDAIYQLNYFDLYKKEIEEKSEEKSADESKPHNIGIVIGNGYILSLLDKLTIDAVLLADAEPVVAFFVLSVRQIILEADDNVDFSIMRKKIIEKIKEIEKIINKENSNWDTSSIEHEVHEVGELHFLSSLKRFRECKAELLIKDLLVTPLNFLDEAAMRKTGDVIRKSNCQINFLNLTNLPHFDKQRNLLKTLEHLPFAPNCASISGSHKVVGIRRTVGKGALLANLKHVYDEVLEWEDNPMNSCVIA